MTYKLTQKKQALEQKLNRLKEEQAKLKLLERKQRISSFVKKGELLEKAELQQLTLPQLYGAFLFLKEQQEQCLQQWDDAGTKALNQGTQKQNNEKDAS